MAEDLKKQASELYRQRSAEESLPTSDALSMKKVGYVTLACAAVILIIVAVAGGFRTRQDPIVAANTPPPLAKETPPPGLLEPAATTTPSQPEPSKTQVIETQKSTPAAAPKTVEPEPVQPAPDASRKSSPAENEKPVLTRDVRKTGSAKRNPPSAQPQPEPAVQPPAPARLSDVEIARRELARSIVVESSSALAELLKTPNSKGWNAEPDGADQYLVTFDIVDEGSGSPAQYVWRVNVATRSVTPLSYYARRLS